jgi:hypothetical protein
MAERTNGDQQTIGPTDSELERWRRAADDALQQLAWAIGYLHGIGKHRQARTLAINRRIIRERILERSGQPLPADAPPGAPDGRAERRAVVGTRQAGRATSPH